MAAQRKQRTSRRKPQPVARRWVSVLATTLSLVMLGGGLAVAYLYLSQPGRLPLRVVEVQGEFRHLSHVAIRDTASAVIDGGFFTCDMQRLRHAVMAMPWVDEVSIRRVWPDRLVMRVSERQPLARWGEHALVSTDAKVFEPDDLGAYADLVSLHGPQGSAARVVAFYEAASAASRLRKLELVAIELDQRRHWWMRFDDGLTVSLGRQNRDARLAQFLRVYPQLIADPRRRPQRIDMRYSHGFAVRWQDMSPAQTGTEEEPQEKV